MPMKGDSAWVLSMVCMGKEEKDVLKDCLEGLAAVV